jgi:histidinol-phosphate aminotransferase
MPALDLDRLAPDFVRRFEAYVPSKPDPDLMRLYGIGHLHRLNNNENPLGPPPLAREVIRRFPPPRASIYPSGDSWHLRQRLAERFGLDPEQFLVGNGANEVIAFVIKAFCQEGDNIVTADRTFAVYEWVAEFSGFEARLAPLKDFGFDEAGLLERVDQRTKIIFVCNPNNPTGTWWDEARLTRFLDQVDARQIVVVDEAYCEFVDAPGFPDSVRLMARYPNLVVFRTFSKMYALAGLRVGYLMGGREVVDMIRRTCVVYSVNVLAQEAALAALADDAGHIAATRALVRREKTYLSEELGRLGLETQHDQGCFMMIRLPMSDTLAYRRLMQQGVMVRSMTGFRYPSWIRVSIGSHLAMEAFVTALRGIL